MGEPLTNHATNSSRDHQLSDKALEANEVETTHAKHTAGPAAARGGFGSKVKRHCARFWWLHLIIFCVIFLIVALCLVYVAMPKIAQDGVNRAHLEVTELKFLNPTPNTIDLTQAAILHSPSIFTPSLDPFPAASYLVTNGTYASAPMVYINMPAIHATHPTSFAEVKEQTVKIEDVNALTDYAIAVLTQEEVTSALTGKTKLHEGKLPVVDVTFNTTTTYKGLNGLKGFNTTNVKLNLTVPAGTPNLKGTAFIPNPSVMTVAMGNVTLTLSTSIGVVGNATVNDMTIVPGDNNFPMTAIIDQPLVLKSLDLKTGLVEMFIEGKDCVYNGEHLTYYETALKSNKLTLQMNVIQILADSS